MPPSGPYCSGCVNLPYGQVYVPPDGTGSSGILAVGDSPWTSEIAAGRPFWGASGFFLDRQLTRLGISRPSLTIANALNCKPPHLGWTDQPHKFPEVYSAMRHCLPYLDELVEQRKPKVILAMGNVALRQICAVDDQMERRHSYVHQSIWGIPAVATFHPSLMMQGKQKLTPAFLFAMRRAQEIANGSYRATELNLLCDSHPDAVRAYLHNHLRTHGNRIDLLMVDLETPESPKLDEEEAEEKGGSYQIDRAGFSLSDRTGCSFPWAEPYISILQEALDASEMVAEWASNHFDSRRLIATGLRIKGRVISGMWAWHFLQSDLLKSLGFVSPFFYAGPAFKHMGSINPSYYNAMDNAVGRLCTVGSLEGLKREGRLDRFMRHCVDGDAILVTMGRAGVLVDKEARGYYHPEAEAVEERYVGFMGAIGQEYDRTLEEIQQIIPEQLKPVTRWKKQPKDMEGVQPLPPPEVPTPKTDWKDAMKLVEASQGTITAKEYKAARKRVNEVRNPYLFMRREPFNINSHPQMIGLVKSMGLKPPKKWGQGEEDDSESVEAKYLRKIGKKYPLFKKILYAKQRGKLISTYNWPLDSEGKVHTTYGYGPSTLRKNSKNVNLQNIPKRSDLASEFRKMLIAPPGYYWVTSDGAAIESVLVGYDANSESFMRLAKCGLHGWMTSAYHKEIIPLSLPDRELTKLCKGAKKKWPTDYEVLKRVDHLSAYLGTPARIYEEYPEEFESEAEAAIMQGFFFSTDPGKEVRAWQKEVLQRANQHTPARLDNHFNYRHYFYEIFKYDTRKKCDVLGEDAKRAIAFIPQSDASAIQTEVLLRLAEGYEGMLDRLRLIIHDEIALLAKEDEVEEAATILHTEMIRPIPELPLKSGGLLSIGAETKYGRNLGSWHPETNPWGMREMVVEELEEVMI